ncbi:CheR family methyltransferase [Pelosinus sp. sgz500959]|uniref:CheR family methyltransferase n=1 Tax=Pelosinus sp. sgz500959 TaxID=3242472 RepID=UPI00366BAEBC
MNGNLSSDDFILFQKYIEEQCGISIRDDKAYLIESRLSKFLVKFSLESFEELYQMLSQQKNKALAEDVIDALTTNETLWFREKTPWEFMTETLLERYIQEIRQGKRFRVRIWSAACSTGQEPYSIAMCIDTYLERHGIKDITLGHFEILATDISSTVLQMAKRGKYDSISMARGLDPSYRDRYFRQEGRTWALDEKIKNAVQFVQFNLQKSFSNFGKFDLVFCRYVAIYFSESFKKEIFKKISFSLVQDGILILGNSEVFFDYKEDYDVKQYKNTVFYRVRGGKG